MHTIILLFLDSNRTIEIRNLTKLWIDTNRRTGCYSLMYSDSIWERRCICTSSNRFLLEKRKNEITTAYRLGKSKLII